MYRFIPYIIIAAAAVFYFITSQNRISALVEETATLEAANIQYETAIEELQRFMVNQQTQVVIQQEAARNARQLASEALETIDGHDLEFLSFSRPGLIENRVNNATRDLFMEIENETSN